MRRSSGSPALPHVEISGRLRLAVMSGKCIAKCRREKRLARNGCGHKCIVEREGYVALWNQPQIDDARCERAHGCCGEGNAVQVHIAESLLVNREPVGCKDELWPKVRHSFLDLSRPHRDLPRRVTAQERMDVVSHGCGPLPSPPRRQDLQ